MSNKQGEFQSKPFYCRICGDFALFTDPTTKGGGEKFTYSLPTYEALKGIVDANYWKPTIINIIDECKIINPIRTQTKGVLVPLNNGNQDRFYYTYLTDVCYEIKYHFMWNYDRPDMARDRDVTKHSQIILRSLEHGGRRDIFLGTRECMGYIERIDHSEFAKHNTAYENQYLDFGIQFHSFIYPALGEEDKPLIANFDHARLIDGRITFRRPHMCEIKHDIYDYAISNLRTDEVEAAGELLNTKEYKEKSNESSLRFI